MPAAYRGYPRLSTHILCLLRGGDAVASGAGATGGRARTGAVTRTVHAHDVATFAHAAARWLRAGRNPATRGHDARGDGHQGHEHRADGRARRGRPIEKPRGPGADCGRDAHCPRADLDVHWSIWGQAGCQPLARAGLCRTCMVHALASHGSIELMYRKSPPACSSAGLRIGHLKRPRD